MPLLGGYTKYFIIRLLQVDFDQGELSWLSPYFLTAGVDGSRTHRGPQRDPPQVLKTRKPAGT
jgi:hypothetical protein